MCPHGLPSLVTVILSLMIEWEAWNKLKANWPRKAQLTHVENSIVNGVLADSP